MNRLSAFFCSLCVVACSVDDAPSSSSAQASSSSASSSGHGGSGGSGGAGGAAMVDPTNGAWRSGFALPGAQGFGVEVLAVARGSGGTYFAAGTFDWIGETRLHHVAAWDGKAWTPLGGGVDILVRALVVAPDGTLYAGGDDDVGKGSVLRWDGSTWTPIVPALDGAVWSLALLGSDLLIGGAFTTDGTTTANAVARFSQGTFSPVGGGLIGTAQSFVVVDAKSFCVGGQLLPPGSMDPLVNGNVACWNGAQWSLLGDGLPGGVRALRRDAQGVFVAGGSFAFQTGPSGSDYIAGLARLEGGLWKPLAGGVDLGSVNEVRALAFEPDGTLDVGGTFELVGKGGQNLPAAHYARLSAQGVWTTVGAGFENRVGVYLADVEGVHSIALDSNGKAALLGGIFSNADTHAAMQLAKTANNSFDATVAPAKIIQGLTGFASCAIEDGPGRVVVAGPFSNVGSTPAHNVATLDHGAWTELDASLPPGTSVLAKTQNGTLIAGGAYDHLWRRLSGVWQPFGPHFQIQNDNVLIASITLEPSGSLIVAGKFDHVDGKPAASIGRFDGSSFSPFGPGLEGETPAGDRSPSVVTTTLVDATGRLVAGGTFNRSGKQKVVGLASWDGAGWTAVGGGLSEDGTFVSRIAELENDLVVAGDFTTIGGKKIPGLARWDGKTFSPLGDALSSFGGAVSPIVLDIVPYGKGLFVAGVFDKVGALPVSYLAFYDGALWHDLGGGLSDVPFALTRTGTTLLALGPFLVAGSSLLQGPVPSSKSVPSSGIAAWDFGP